MNLMQIIIFIPKYYGQLFSIGLRDDSKNHLAWFVNTIRNEKHPLFSNYFHKGLDGLRYKDFYYYYPIDRYKEAEEYILELAIRLSEELCCDVNILNNE
jgi:hypothetical protein